ncbi:MAG: histidinol dehydrogenase [Bacteroidaceae bacterium]|nr:histidinol dehydrogenase [Bacteroidaceae bacterium]
MRYIKYPLRETWTELLKRPTFDVSGLFGIVSSVIEQVKNNGDRALRELELKFDKVELTELTVNEIEFQKAEAEISSELKKAILIAYNNITAFHKAQKFTPIKVETSPGVICEQRAVPIEKVGLYVPGGTAPLFSTVLMLAIPAKIAGCSDIVLCTPPQKDGRINSAVLYAAQLAGVTNVYKVGGSQAIAAMAYGTESVPKVDKIFGPGNQYVTAAKQLVSLSEVAIDMPAGPSEVEVLVDDSCNPAFVAADLLSQAEHGTDSQVILVSTSSKAINGVQAEVEKQLQLLPRKELAQKSLEHSLYILVKDIDEAIDITNTYAPEHLVIATNDYRKVADRIVHAGSIFLGNYSCESAGDYASGTNHTLPTKGYARAYSGLCLDSFQRKMTLQELREEGIRSIGNAVALMAEGESLTAHQRAMTIRLETLGN